MTNKLLSIVTPCYNGEHFIHRLLDSILRQTYSKIEMFVINDGSTDKTEDVVHSYIPLFEKRGYTLHCVTQKNAGQSAAINNGIKRITGDYLIWPDSDDYYIETTAFEQMIQALDSSDDSVGIVRCYSQLVSEETEQAIGIKGHKEHVESIFEDCLFARETFWWGAGNYMVKTSALRRVLPSFSIYTQKDAGQNWQLLLPIFYHFQCLTLCEELHAIVVREDSHSRGQYSSFEEKMRQIDAYERTILLTLRNLPHMPQDEIESYSNQIKLKYARERLGICVMLNKIDQWPHIYKRYEYKNLSLKYDLFTLFSLSKVGCYLLAKTIQIVKKIRVK